MKRLFFGVAAIVLFSFAQVGFVHASTNDFVINDFSADYYLNKDNSGQSTLKTVESIAAEFPNYDQNHGIERSLPLSYDGHITGLKIESVTNNSGDSLQYSINWQNDNLVIRIGNKNTYVHGLQNYVITYSRRNVTRFYSDTNSDEFYWDINGTEWNQSFGKVTARLHIDSSIYNYLNGKKACYYGSDGSTNNCVIEKSNDVFVASSSNLKSGENMTIAVGFKPKTFNQYKLTISDFIEKYVILISTIISLIILTILLVIKKTRGSGVPGRGTIIAEYLPPKDADIALSSIIAQKSITWVSAMYIDLAVRHKIKIIENIDNKKTSYVLELMSCDGLSTIETEVVKLLFSDDLKKGAQYEIRKDKSDFIFATKITKIYKQANTAANIDGYYLNSSKLKLKMTIIGAMIIIQAAIFEIIYGSGAIYVGIIASIMAMIIIISIKPLSEKGRNLCDYLKGLEMYIKIAEQDRLKFLQSPKGAEKTVIDTDDKQALVHLYERVLPYAVLFGNEKEWTKVLGEYYEKQNIEPDWYFGNNIFNAMVFSSVLSDFSKNATYGASYSSTSGGSGGGGFSGGGGGGGGGGGW